MEMILRFIIAGGVITLVSYLAENRLPHVAGIIMTFPFITILSFIIVPMDQLKTVAVWGLIGAAALIVFLIIFLASYKLFGGNYRFQHILISLATWAVFLLIISQLITNRFAAKLK